jgi:hypothetical protein
MLSPALVLGVEGAAVAVGFYLVVLVISLGPSLRGRSLTWKGRAYAVRDDHSP